MKRPIGFDVENIEKVTKNLSPQKNSNNKISLEDMDDHVLRLSGEVLALGGILRHLLDAQSVAQQENILKRLLHVTEQVKGLKLSPAGTKVQNESLEAAKSFIDLLNLRVKRKP